MAEQPACPYCGARLFPHEVSNDQCGTCGGQLPGAAGWSAPEQEGPAPAASPPIRIDLPLTLPGRPPPEAFAAVRQGINLVCWGVLLNLVFGLLGAAAHLAVERIEDTPVSDTALLFGTFGALLQLGSLSLAFIGVCFCCLIPKGCEARQWAQGAVLCLIMALALAYLLVFWVLLTGVLTIGPLEPFWGQTWSGETRPAVTGYYLLRYGPMTDSLPVVGFVGSVLALVGPLGAFCYFQLLAAVARFFGDPRLARSLTLYFYFSFLVSCICACGGVFALVLQAWTKATYPSVASIPVSDVVTCAGLMLGLALSVWLLILLTRLHRLIPVPGEPAPGR